MSKTHLAAFVHSVIEQRPADSQKLFKNIMSEKILHKLAEKRQSMAKTLFRNLDEEVKEEEWCVCEVGMDKKMTVVGKPFTDKNLADKKVEELKKNPGNKNKTYKVMSSEKAKA